MFGGLPLPSPRRPYALHCRAGVHARRGGLGRGTPLFCVSAAPQGRGGVRQTGRVLARSCAAPLSRLTPTAPLTGEPSGRQSLQSLPCKGRWMRRKAQTEGCIAGLRPKYPTRPGRALPCPRRGRCSHRPGNPAVAQGPRGGRNRPPYIAAINRCQPANASHPPGPPAGRCKHRPLRRRHPQGVRRPAVPSPAARMPCIAGRAFTPAGEVWGGVTPLFCVSAAPQGGEE